MCSCVTFAMQHAAQQDCAAAAQGFLAYPAPAYRAALLIRARILSLLALGGAVGGALPSMALRAFEVAHLVRQGGLWPDPLLRSGMSAALGLAAIAGRIATAAMGVLSPELTFHLLKLHKVVLFLGLLQGAQLLSRADAPWVGSGILSGQRRRWNMAWAVTRTAAQAATRVYMALRTAGPGGLLHAPLNPTGTPATEVPFYPNLFHEALPGWLHREVQVLFQQGMYTKDELEDTSTAWAPVLNRAIVRTALSLFKLVGVNVCLAGTGQPILPLLELSTSADLAACPSYQLDPSVSLLAIWQLANSAQADPNLWEVLGADADKFHVEGRPSPTLAALFRLVVAFRVAIVEKDFAAMSGRYCGAFVVDEPSPVQLLTPPVAPGLD